MIETLDEIVEEAPPQPRDQDPAETREWLDALSAVMREYGPGTRTISCLPA